MAQIHLRYLNHHDVERLAMTDGEILAAVEGGLRAQGRGETAAESARALRSPDVRERLRALGAEPVGGTPAELGAMLKREFGFWGDLIRKQGIRAE